MSDKKIYETITRFEDDLKRTESIFRADAQRFQREFDANRPISYSFGSSNNLDEQLAYNLSAIETMKRLNYRFHADCEAMIIAIDSTCRPFLTENPSEQAVGALVELLQNICNSISDTVTVFDMSFNGRNIGEVGSIQPEASVVARATLKFWKNYYENMPGYRENCLRIAREKRDKEQAMRDAERAKQEAKRQEDQRKALAKEEKEAAWRSVKAHRNHIAAEGETLILSFTKAVKKEKENIRAQIIQSAKAALEQDLADANQQQAKLGFFAFKAKSNLKKQIIAIQNDLLHIEQSHYARKKLDDLNRKETTAIGTYRKKIDLYLNKRFECTENREYNCPFEVDAGETKFQREQENIKRNILIELNSCNEPIDVDTLMRSSYKIGGYSKQKISALLVQLLQSGYVVRSERNREALYAIARKLSVTITEQWTENEQMANTPLPEAPSVESVFL